MAVAGERGPPRQPAPLLTIFRSTDAPPAPPCDVGAESIRRVHGIELAAQAELRTISAGVAVLAEELRAAAPGEGR